MCGHYKLGSPHTVCSTARNLFLSHQFLSYFVPHCRIPFSQKYNIETQTRMGKNNGRETQSLPQLLDFFGESITTQRSDDNITNIMSHMTLPYDQLIKPSKQDSASLLCSST